jgi:hypothetical protein
MRIGHLVLCTLVAATAAAGLLGDASRADGARRPQPPRQLLVEVTFSLQYSNHWWTASGRREAACDPWREDEGTNDVWAQNLGAAARPRAVKPLRGQVTFGRATAQIAPGVASSWALVNVVGDATGAIRRHWEQDGGPQSSPCGGRAVQPFERLPDDCSRFSTSTRAATIRAEFRKESSDFFQLTHAVPRGKPVVAVSVPLGNGAWRLPFTTCKTTMFAPEIIGNLGLPVRSKDIRALRTLGLGRTYRLSWEGAKKVAGDCDRASPNDARSGCEFEVRGWIDLRRVRTFG